MHRATISAADGRFPEAHFDGRRVMEPSIGYALTRLCAQARMRGTGIRVEVDDAGTRLLLVIDAEGRLHTPAAAQGRDGSRALTETRSPAGASTPAGARTPAGAQAPAGAPIRARSDASAPTHALPLTPEGAEGGAAPLPGDRRRTFTANGDPAPALTPPSRGARLEPSPRVAIDSATSDARRQAEGPDDAHSISVTTPAAALPEPHAGARRHRGGLLAAVVLTALIACGALLLLT